MPRTDRSDGKSPNPAGECGALASIGAVWVPFGALRGQLVPQHSFGPGWSIFGVRLVDSCSYRESPAPWQSQQEKFFLGCRVSSVT